MVLKTLPLLVGLSLAALLCPAQPTDRSASAAMECEPQPQHSPRVAPAATETSSSKRPLVALKTNTLYYAVGAANLGVELFLGNRFSVHLPVVYSPYTLSSSYQFRLLAVEPEVRYWLNRSGVGHVFGLYGQAGYYNVAWNDRWRYQDRGGNSPAWGVGVSYGYAFAFAPQWRLELHIGLGYTHTTYDRFHNVPNGSLLDTGVLSYWGVNKLGVCVCYVFNRKNNE